MNPQARTKTTPKASNESNKQSALKTEQHSGQTASVSDSIFNTLANRILETQDANELFTTATNELRQSLSCDRAAIYQFNDDWSGQFIADSADGVPF